MKLTQEQVDELSEDKLNKLELLCQLKIGMARARKLIAENESEKRCAAALDWMEYLIIDVGNIYGFEIISSDIPAPVGSCYEEMIAEISDDIYLDKPTKALQEATIDLYHQTRDTIADFI